jgi:uncharacterized protein YukE
MTIFVDYAAIASTQSTLRSGKDEIESTLQRLIANVRQLTDTGFKTEKASLAFFENYDAWNKQAAQAIAALDGMNQALQAVIDGHQNLDSGLAGRG